jgi:hypothetical protein
MTKLEFVGLVGDIMHTTLVNALFVVMEKIFTLWWMKNVDDMFVLLPMCFHTPPVWCFEGLHIRSLLSCLGALRIRCNNFFNVASRFKSVWCSPLIFIC